MIPSRNSVAEDVLKTALLMTSTETKIAPAVGIATARIASATTRGFAIEATCRSGFSVSTETPKNRRRCRQAPKTWHGPPASSRGRGPSTGGEGSSRCTDPSRPPKSTLSHLKGCCESSAVTFGTRAAEESRYGESPVNAPNGPSPFSGPICQRKGSSRWMGRKIANTKLAAAYRDASGRIA